MTQLKFKVVCRNEVYYRDLDKFISAMYDRPFEFVADQEATNYSKHSFDGVKKEPIDDYDQSCLDAFRADGEASFLTRALLTDLCNRDLIPEGDYLIDVFW